METLSVNEVTMPPRTTPNFTQSDGVSLRDHLEDKIATTDKATQARLDAVEQAALVATRTLEKRLEGMNEFRAAMGDLSNRMATRAEVEVQNERIKADIKEFRTFMNTQQGKASQASVSWSMALGGIATVIGLISLYLRLFSAG